MRKIIISSLIILITIGLFSIAQPTEAGFFDWFSWSKFRSFFSEKAIEEKLPASVSESINEITPQVSGEANSETPKEIIKETTTEKIIYKDNPEHLETIENLKNQIVVLENRIKELEKQLEEVGQVVEPLIPLEITLIEIEKSYNSATITWLSNKYSNSIAEYGSDYFTYEHKTDGDTTVASSNKYLHTVYLKNLKPETTYHYNVFSVDNDGQRTQGGDKIFTTLSVPPSKVGTLSISSVVSDFPTFKFTTGEEGIKITKLRFKVDQLSRRFTIWTTLQTGLTQITNVATSSDQYIVFDKNSALFYEDELFEIPASASRNIEVRYEPNDQIVVIGIETIEDIQAVGLKSGYNVPKQNIIK